MSSKQQTIKIPDRIEKTLVFLIILFLPTQLGKHFWPPQSLVYSLKIDYLAPVLYFWDVLVLLALAVWVFKRLKINPRALLILVLFLLTQSFSIAGSQNPVAALVRLEQFLIAGLFGVFLASQNFNNIKSELVKGLSLAVLLESLIALFQFLTSRAVGLWIVGERSFTISTPSIATFNWYGQVFLRSYGSFPHPNVLGAFMVLTMPLILLLTDQEKKKQTLTNMAVALGFISALLSFSRASILILFLEAFIFLKNRFKLFLAIILIAAPFLYIRFNSALNFDSLSITRREELAQVALEQFANHPLIGVGLNNFINQVASLNLLAGPSRFLQPVHNIFLLSLAETGLVGCLGLLLLFGSGLWNLRRLSSDKFQLSFIGIFLIIFFLGMLDHYFLTLAQGQRLLFLIWGLTFCLPKLKQVH